MSFLLRKISKAKWFAERPFWLQEGEITADALADLKTDKGDLSVWLVNDPASELDMAILAVAVTGDKIARFDYVLISSSNITNNCIDIEITDGITALKPAITMHRDISKITVAKIAQICDEINSCPEALRGSYSPKQIIALFKAAVATGDMDLGKLSDKLSQHLKEQGVID